MTAPGLLSLSNSPARKPSCMPRLQAACRPPGRVGKDRPRSPCSVNPQAAQSCRSALYRLMVYRPIFHWPMVCCRLRGFRQRARGEAFERRYSVECPGPAHADIAEAQIPVVHQRRLLGSSSVSRATTASGQARTRTGTMKSPACFLHAQWWSSGRPPRRWRRTTTSLRPVISQTRKSSRRA